MVAVSAVSALVASIVTVSALRPATPTAPAATATSAPVAASTPAATLGSGAGPASASSPPTLVDVTEAVQRTSPSVVAIDITTTGRGFGGRTVTGTVSGFVVRADGLILTANHLVADASSISVELTNGKSATAQVAASDAANDLAVLKISASGLTAAHLGSAAHLVIGQTLLTLGGPQEGGSGSVSSGILSATGRSVTLQDPVTGQNLQLDKMLQTDAAISADNEGGPVLNVAGDVVGVAVTAADSSQGIGFAVPIDVATALIAKAGGN